MHEAHQLGANKHTLLPLPPRGPAEKATVALFPSLPRPPVEQAVESPRERTDRTGGWMMDWRWWVSGMEVAKRVLYSSGLGRSPHLYVTNISHM